MAPFGIRLDHCLVGELVVLPDQLVGSVVFIGDGGRPPGDRGYVPVVVVGVAAPASGIVYSSCSHQA